MSLGRPGRSPSLDTVRVQMQKLTSLELLRAAAATLVVAFHAQWIFGQRFGTVPFHGALAAGFRGVDLFFVLSGFIIAFVHGKDVGHPGRIGRYLRNRSTRIYPAVWVMSLFAIGAYLLGTEGADRMSKLAPYPLAASFLLLPQQGAALVNVTWTLTYEMFFYAVFALAIVDRRLGIAAFAAWQAATLAVALSGADPGLPGYYLRAICLEFGIGMACAWALPRCLREPLRAGLWWTVLAAGVGAFALGMAVDASMPWAGAMCAIGSGLVVLSLPVLENRRAIRVASFAVRMGGASYSIYLVHFPVVILLSSALLKLHGPHGDAACLACVVAGIAAGFAFDALVDKPIQRLLRRRPASAGPAVAGIASDTPGRSA